MIWLIGNRGMLGSDVETALQTEQMEFISSDLDVDITDINSLKNFTENRDIRWIINCSAYAAVDNAEDDYETAFRINAEGVKNIASVAKENNAVLIHISTDYVFDGTKDDEYLEEDSTGPTGVYGKSKLRGEKYLLEITEKYFIIRTSWLYGKNGNNFINTMLRLFKERDEVNVVNDQWGSPTYTVDLALLVIEIIKSNSNEYGIYHFSSDGKINWHEFASYIKTRLQEMKIIKKDVSVNPIPTSGFPTKAQRPANSYMSKEKVKRTFGFIIPDWKDSVERYLKDYIKS
jgi:dTDP-4-dehydrorhamnose reductase